MQSRTFFQYIIISLKGIAMGAADVVPGVSGGTIAFISGIYEELISTIHRLDLGFFKHWKKEGFAKAWNSYNLSFLTALFAGIALSILSLAKLITWLLEVYPIQVWSFFFGLVLASILYVGKQITKWNAKAIIALLIAIAISYFITIANPLGSSDSLIFLFFAGFVAIIAMILPGISGAFILLLLGAYAVVVGTISNFIESVTALDWELFKKSVLQMTVFSLGALVGLKAFSRILNWMFANHKNTTLAVLTGFMIGALNKIWPWKEVDSYRIDSHGKSVPFIDHSVMPGQYEGDSQLVFALLFLALGFLSIFMLERIASRKKAN